MNNITMPSNLTVKVTFPSFYAALLRVSGDVTSRCDRFIDDNKRYGVNQFFIGRHMFAEAVGDGYGVNDTKVFITQGFYSEHKSVLILAD
jgi:hypothetical protein